jgi:hypothetical protein
MRNKEWRWPERNEGRNRGGVGHELFFCRWSSHRLEARIKHPVNQSDQWKVVMLLHTSYDIRWS